MTHDAGRPKDTIEEREHGVFVPPDEQHVREDGTPTEPTESAERAENDSATDDPDRVEAIGTAAVPHAPESGTDPASPQPATPLDTGTAEDAERADEVGTAEDTEPTQRVEDVAAEDETRAADADHMDARNVDLNNIDDRNVDDHMDARNAETDYISTDNVHGSNVHGSNVDGSNVDGSNAETTIVDATNAETTNADEVDTDEVDASNVDADEVAVGTASVPQQSAAPAAEGIWPDGLVDDLRSRWDAVQLRFVDDPSGVASDAKALVGEAVTAIRDAIDRLEAKLDETVSDATDETEQLRQRVAHYRDVFESLLKR